MKINDILECFNKALDANGNPKRIHYVAHSSWERKIGAVKSASTIITLCDPQEGTKDIITSTYTTNIPTGQEEVLLEETQRRALIEFIKNWDHDTGVRGEFLHTD